MHRVPVRAVIEGLKHLRGQALYRMNLRSHQSGATAGQFSVEKARDYARRVVDDYIAYGGNGDAGRIAGRDILEVGPGDSLSVAMVLLAKGANSVTCVDGFAPSTESGHRARVYAAIHASLVPEEQERIRDIVRIEQEGITLIEGGRLVSRYGVPIDDGSASAFAPKQFDIILSRAVLEHLADLEAGWEAMVKWLRPDGAMWHKVDFRCHNLFGKVHPLYFLTIGQPLWDWISRPDPTLNRMRVADYRKLLSRSFEHSRVFYTHLVGQESELLPHVETLEGHYGPPHLEAIRQIRPALIAPFDGQTDEELVVEGIFLSASSVRR